MSDPCAGACRDRAFQGPATRQGAAQCNAVIDQFALGGEPAALEVLVGQQDIEHPQVVDGTIQVAVAHAPNDLLGQHLLLLQPI